MKHFLTLMLLALPFFGASQLPNGSVAPDFTVTDIAGDEHNLYSYLDSGYAVIIDFSELGVGHAGVITRVVFLKKSMRHTDPMAPTKCASFS